jgi:ABC-type amino acid transport substrate-binding protein
MEQALHPRAERGVMSRSLPYLKELLAALLLSALLPSAAFAADEETDPLESSDVLVRAKAKGMLTACADPYDFPYSLQNSDPPGFDVEIMRSIAKRGGTSRAFRNSILSRKCDVFLGLSDNGDDDMLMHRMVFTKPYIGMGYVLVTQGKAAGLKTIEDVRDANMKLAVAMSTPMDDYLFMNKVPREIYMDNRRIMGGLIKGEVDAGLMWSTALGVARLEFPKAQFKMVEGYVPGEGHRFNGVWAIRKEDKNLIKFVNEGIDELLSNGRIKEIVESYGVPFYSPFP